MTGFVWRSIIVYGSPGDEHAFFGWLQSIEGVLGVRGVGTALHVTLAPDAPTRDAAIELVALFRRYAGDLEDLAALVTPDNEAWLAPLLANAPR